VRQPFVGGALFQLQAHYRRTRLLLARFQGATLLVGGAPLGVEQLAFVCRPLEILGRALQLHVQSNDGLFFAMKVGLYRHQRARQVSNSCFERGHFDRRLIAIGRLGRNTVAELFDFALDAKNAPPSVFAAARQENAAANHFAGGRRNGG
jgi:hypothetical protein